MHATVHWLDIYIVAHDFTSQICYIDVYNFMLAFYIYVCRPNMYTIFVIDIFSFCLKVQCACRRKILDIYVHKFIFVFPLLNWMTSNGQLVVSWRHPGDLRVGERGGTEGGGMGDCIFSSQIPSYQQNEPFVNHISTSPVFCCENSAREQLYSTGGNPATSNVPTNPQNIATFCEMNIFLLVVSI
jgi:hypothetical protein